MSRVFSVFVLLPFLLIMARGSLGEFPLTKNKISISDNNFVNTLSRNGIFHFVDAFIDRKKSNLSGSTEGILNQAGVKNFPELKTRAGYSNEYPLVAKTARNDFLDTNPPHVIFVMMEGWSTDIALKDSQNTLGEFYKHSEGDYFFTRSFSNEYGTNPSIESVLLNSPITPLSQSTFYSVPFVTSNVIPFKKKGYNTFFISGTDSSWRNHDMFWPHQGFDQLMGRVSIESEFRSSSNTWGAYDGDVFNYLQKHLSDRDKPSFYFVLTTNNHLPVTLPPEYQARNFNSSLFESSERTHEFLSSFHYMTDSFGKFLSWLKKSKLKDKVIVVATGDHILKGFANYTQSEKAYLRYSVPTYFYLPEPYDRLKGINQKVATSHVDIFPTLFELSLSGAEYYQFGQSLMGKSLASSYGFIEDRAFLVKEGVVEARNRRFYRWKDNFLLEKQGKPLLSAYEDIVQREKYRNFLKNISSTRVKRTLVGDLC